MRTIKFRILLICMAVFLTILLLTSLLLMRYIQGNLNERELESGEYSLTTSIANVDRDYTQVLQFLVWNSNSKEMTSFLAASRSPAVNRDYARVQAFKAAQNQLYSVSITDVLEKIIISSLHGGHITLGRGMGNTSDVDRAAPFVSRDGDTVYHVIENPFEYHLVPQVIAFSGKVYAESDSQLVGWMDVFLSSDVIVRQFGSAAQGDGSRNFVVIQNEVYEVLEDHIQRVDGGFQQVQSASYTSRAHGVQLGEGALALGDGQFLMARSAVNNWSYIKTFSSPSLWSYSPASLALILSIAGVFLLSAGFLIWLLDRLINRPVKRIIRHIDQIASGDFAPNPAIETPDEFGTIGKGINAMSARIQELIDTTLRTQREKKNYEFKMLQSQINPHFLYNTLNSIKWMAAIQKADGIVETTTRLGRMLQRLVRIKDERIPLSEELQFIDDYIVIQQYRYGDKFRFEYDIADEGLMRAMIIKFTLQPLVENAMFHGLDPQKQGGMVRISAQAQGGDLLIAVWDDGVGIAPEQLARLNAFEEDGDRESNSVGLSNIHHRIQLEHGPAYGLRIESEQGRYTRVTVRIPLTMQDEE